MRSASLLALAFIACGGAPAKPTPTPSPSTSSPRVEPSVVSTPPAKKDGRVVVFRASGFPTIDAPAIDDRVLDEGLAGLPVDRANDRELVTRLGAASTLVLPYGSAFPVDAWSAIRAFLKSGGNLAVLGGAPFHEPVYRAGDAFTRGPRATTFAHDLLIGPAEAVPRAQGSTVVTHLGLPIRLEPKTTWALTIRLATRKDFPDEHGSDGPPDAIVRPLVHVVDAEKTPRGAAVIEIDHENGARWVLATSDAPVDAAAIKTLVTKAMEGSSSVRVMPVKASIAPGEKLALRIEAKRVKAAPWRATVSDAAGKELFTADIALGLPTEKLAPGFYRVKAGDVETAFWVRDDKLLGASPKMTASRDWLKKDGRTFPIIGTTYMASDVHRRFLFEPNPAAWDRDFAEMKRRGIGFVRTGLWTAWSRVQSDDGKVDDKVLSAIDAFVQTAARHGIVVCFDFFAFLPPAHGGTNAYLDPRSLAGQEALLRAVASRFKGSSWVHWDLINEPSYSPRSKLWSTRAIGDDHEKAAWREWVKRRHGLDEGKLRALWREPAPDVLAVPQDADFAQVAMQIDKRPRRARDFREFTDEVLTGWAARMRKTLKSAAGESTLVTLGQDEGGIYERPTQQLMASALDYSAVHTWWKNDDLLWDGVVTKVADKAMLHQETGLMRLEDIDGTPWRTPDAAAALLERKLGYAFAARGAGVVEWVWNVNPTMPIDEESTIGLFRPDGTAKPELDVLQSFAKLFAQAAPLLDDFAPDPVVLVVPHARAFLGKTNAIDATKIVVRTLAERFGVVPTAVSDLLLSAERLSSAKLVVVPCPDVLDEPAAKALLDASKRGVKVLVTGAIDGDSYGRETPSLKAMGLLGSSRPVAMHETSAWGPLAFEGLLQESARRANKPSVAKLEGNLWHEPLPIELARAREPLAKLLGAALAAAAVPTMPGEWGVTARVLVAPKSALVAVVNERPEPTSRRVVAFGRTLSVPVRAFGARLAIVERATGKIVAATPGEDITGPDAKP